MASFLEKLVSLSGRALGSHLSELSERSRSLAGPRAGELENLLKKRNGFYAFESALHVFPSAATAPEHSLDSWNSPGLWRDAYEDLAQEYLFFAEDVFGGQFCIADSRVCSFDPETGELETLAWDLDSWAERLLADYEVLTGFPLAHNWQAVNGPLASGLRLVPRVPFVAGGDFVIENLYAMESVKAMRFRGSIALQIRDMPDGTQFRIEVVE